MHNNINTIRKQLAVSKPNLLWKQNVVATGVGYKKVSGRETRQLSIVCSVEKKLPISKIGVADRIPPFIQGIPTDVQDTGIILAFSLSAGRYRPAPGGVSAGHFEVPVGTLGCLVRRESTIYILSNNHILANTNKASVNDAILQPGRRDGGKEPVDRIALLSEFVPIRFIEEEGLLKQRKGIAALLPSWTPWRGRQKGPDIAETAELPENRVDCALALPLTPELVSGEILEIGKITGTRKGELGMDVWKYGRTTGLTNGILSQTDVTAQIHYGRKKSALFTDQLIAGPMSRSGDSGAAVLTGNNELVGLLFAGSDRVTLINRIENILDILQVTIC